MWVENKVKDPKSSDYLENELIDLIPSRSTFICVLRMVLPSIAPVKAQISWFYKISCLYARYTRRRVSRCDFILKTISYHCHGRIIHSICRCIVKPKIWTYHFFRQNSIETKIHRIRWIVLPTNDRPIKCTWRWDIYHNFSTSTWAS